MYAVNEEMTELNKGGTLPLVRNLLASIAVYFSGGSFSQMEVLTLEDVFN